ncbi:MAG TPA: IS630 family transposase, partial [Cyanobacteria bacterium UBA11049]|nr:IS630 family transposase [Cyanobacteria bacterium UBA11049]
QEDSQIISEEAIERLGRELQDPEGFEIYGEVQTWLAAELGIKASDKVVHSTVR